LTLIIDQNDLISRFWAKYFELIQRFGIKVDTARWYEMYAVDYLDKYKNHGLKTHTKGDIETFLNKLVRNRDN